MKNVELLGDFASLDEAIEIIDDVIKNGEIIPEDSNNYAIEKDSYRVVIANDENGNWVLTAFDKDTPAKEKKKGKTPPPQSPPVSQMKGQVLSPQIFPGVKVVKIPQIRKLIETSEGYGKSVKGSGLFDWTEQGRRY